MNVRNALHRLPLAVLMALSIASCGKQGAATGEPPAPEVGVVTLAPQPIDLSIELPGRTSAYRIAEVRPQVQGIIERRLFTEGSEVKAGQALYQIDAAPYRAAVARAQADLANAEAQQNAARLAAERSASLVGSGLVSKQDDDNLQAAARSSAAAVASAKAALESAQIDLAYAQIRSPISGRIGRSLVTEGALVQGGQAQPLATVAQLDPIYVDVTESSADLLRLREELSAGRLQRVDESNARVTLELENGARYPHDGKLQFTEVTVDEGTGSVLLRAEFPNPDRLLLPGMFVRARLPEGKASQALLVPQAAVSRNARGEAVVLLVGPDNKAVERVIQIDRVVDNQWLVKTGLASGDQIIVEGLQKVRAGSAVKPMPAGQSLPGSAPAPADAPPADAAPAPAGQGA
ncbi:MAG: efflux RND transporter periplasmic adaptor subunit [Nevskiaceae bacterium]|jgi:membrane fusion protein (multidrug efflux system)|nr:efflux RND transporter periplasmic adaptor subunit [Nevskiaceae bacterium]